VLRTKDKNGQVVERMYVRVGNMSRELAVSEIGAYLAGR